MQCIPVMLKKRELLASAPTGSGKTAAFAIPILAALKVIELRMLALAVSLSHISFIFIFFIQKKPQRSGIRAVIVSPTRELAQQIHRDFVRLAKGKDWKIVLLTKKAVTQSSETGEQQFMKWDILITTPMRLVSLIQKESLKLNQ
jgi:ATP-dependent RNA helicase DDX52/ROK1